MSKDPLKKGARRGYTTGACVQAATRAAALTVATGYVPCEAPADDGLKGDKETTGTVEIVLPNGESAGFFITMHAEGVCSVVKYAGDDPDVTNGVKIYVCVSARLDGCFSVDGAEGVGRVTLAGLPVAVDNAAINPVPMKHILAEAERVLPSGADVTVSVPDGDELAKRTFNPRLGILGGISILGTTGRVEPWSTKAYQESLVPQLDVMRAAGIETPVLVPGAKGERAARAAGYHSESIAQTGNYVGMMVAAAAERGFAHIILVGHTSKLAKLARGDFDTHSRRSPAPLDVLADCAESSGWDVEQANKLKLLPTTEAALRRLLDQDAGAALACAAARAAQALRREYGIEAQVLLTDGEGEIVGRG